MVTESLSWLFHHLPPLTPSDSLQVCLFPFSIFFLLFRPLALFSCPALNIVYFSPQIFSIKIGSMLCLVTHTRQAEREKDEERKWKKMNEKKRVPGTHSLFSLIFILFLYILFLFFPTNLGVAWTVRPDMGKISQRLRSSFYFILVSFSETVF